MFGLSAFEVFTSLFGLVLFATIVTGMALKRPKRDMVTLLIIASLWIVETDTYYWEQSLIRHLTEAVPIHAAIAASWIIAAYVMYRGAVFHRYHEGRKSGLSHLEAVATLIGVVIALGAIYSAAILITRQEPGWAWLSLLTPTVLCTMIELRDRRLFPLGKRMLIVLQ